MSNAPVVASGSSLTTKHSKALKVGILAALLLPPFIPSIVHSFRYQLRKDNPVLFISASSFNWYEGTVLKQMVLPNRNNEPELSVLMSVKIPTVKDPLMFSVTVPLEQLPSWRSVEDGDDVHLLLKRGSSGEIIIEFIRPVSKESQPPAPDKAKPELPTHRGDSGNLA